MKTAFLDSRRVVSMMLQTLSEPNALPVSQWDVRPFRVLVTRLSTWTDTLDSITHRVLYGILRKHPQVFPDMAFVPGKAEAERLAAQKIAWLTGMATGRGVREFQCLALSNALVQELINIPVVLAQSGVPHSFAERMNDESLPLVVLGGANSIYTSALFGPDPLVDGIWMGEDPASILELFSRIVELRSKGMTKRELLEQLRDIPGWFLPCDLPRPVAVKPHGKPALNEALMRSPVPLAAGRAGVGTLQISEGCPYFCSFCAESWSRKPWREVPAESVRRDALALKAALGLRKVDLYSFNFNTHSEVHELLAGLLEDFADVGLKSQRFDQIARDPVFPRLLHLAGKTSITCGMEGISERLRAYLQKDLNRQQLSQALDALLRVRLREIKVSLIVTGLETEEDHLEFREFLREFAQMLHRAEATPRVVFSATPLVRFPWTPLEFEDAPDREPVYREVRRIKADVVAAGFEYRDAAPPAEYWVSQVLARARDPRILQAAGRAALALGWVFRESVDDEFAQRFAVELSAAGLDLDALLQGHAPEDSVPWDGLDPGVDRRFLAREWKHSREFLQTPVCLGNDTSPGKCLACGACSTGERTAIVSQHALPRLDLDALGRKIRGLRASEQVVTVRVRLADACCNAPLDTLHAALARALFAAAPALVQPYRRPASGSEPWDRCGWAGERNFSISLLPAGAELLETHLRSSEFLALSSQAFSEYGEILGLAQGDLPLYWSFRGAAAQVDSWLREHGLKSVLRKDGAWRVHEPSRDALKKRLVSNVRVLHALDGEPEGWDEVRVEALGKFDAVEFRRAVFAGDCLVRCGH